MVVDMECPGPAMPFPLTVTTGGVSVGVVSRRMVLRPAAHHLGSC